MNTNIIKSCFVVFLAGFLWYACGEEESVGQQPMDSVPPGPVSDVTVRSIAGGAVLGYRLPGDEDLLYVKAIYTRNGETCEARTSLYLDTVQVEGFGDMEPHEVRLFAVDRSRNESTPVIVNVEPLEPIVSKIDRSLDMIAAIGGVNLSWENIERADVMVNVVVNSDSLMEYIPFETFYTSARNGEGTIREMDTVPYDLGVYIQDMWGNRSKMKYYELTPFFEQRFDRMKFRAVRLPNDATPLSWGFFMEEMWDGIWGAEGGYSTQAGQDPMPHALTIDLGVSGVITRIRIHQRGGYSYWNQGNIRVFEVWGCENIDMTGNWNSWTKLMDCESIKLSGLPVGEYTDEDLARAIDGEDFNNSNIGIKVRYIRLNVFTNWSGGDNIQIGEIQVYGAPDN